MAGDHLWTELIEQIPMGLIIWHLENLEDASTFRITITNQLARQVLGLSAPAMIPDSDIKTMSGVEAIESIKTTQSIEEDPFPAFLKIESPKAYAEMIRTNTGKDLGEIRYRDNCSTERVFWVKAFPMSHQRVGVVFEDISDRKRIEDTLKLLERKLLFHLKQTPLAIIEWNLDFEVMEWNPGAEKIFLYNRREVLGKPITALIIPSSLKSDFQNIWHTLIDLKTSFTSISQNMTADGRLIVCEWHSTSLVDVDGNVIGVFSIVQDITDRQQTETALLTSAIRYRRLFEASQDGVLIVDAATGQITEANPFLLNLLGYSQAELLGKKLWEIVTPSQVQSVQTMMQQLQVSSSLRSKDLSLYTKEGQSLDVEFVSSAYIAGERQVIQCNIRDMTQRKRSEAELRQFAKRLEQSNQELENFASIASHDLQEPLRKIQSFGERLHTKYADVLDEEGRDYLQRMQNAAHRMQTLINDLLSFSRITTNAKPFVLVDLTHIVREVLSDLEIQIQQTNAQISLAELPTIEADPTQMRQLFQNLISNAIKFHRPDVSPQIQLQCSLIQSQHRLNTCKTLISDSRNQCQIQVIDNGIGFEEQYLDRIFAMFQRLHGCNEYNGTGIGLSICRKIVERHGGEIFAHSVLDQGSVFTVVLPLRQG